jgi:hypothetical protein
MGGRASDGSRRPPPPERLKANDEAVEEAFRETCREIKSLLPEDERLIFPLWLRSERKTEVYAEALGIPSETPIAEQRRTVRRAKDRLSKRLRRSPTLRERAAALREALAAYHGLPE